MAQEELYYKDYEVLHLGASYKASKNVTVNARINNLLDRDFTPYTPRFNSDANNDGDYLDTGETTFYDDYNNKDKRRNFWVSVNLAF